MAERCPTLDATVKDLKEYVIGRRRCGVARLLREVHYVFQGAVRKYRPDFLVRMVDGSTLVLEVKGQDTSQDQTKREFLAEWVEAVSEQGGFGQFVWDVSHTPSDIGDILAKHAPS